MVAGMLALRRIGSLIGRKIGRTATAASLAVALALLVVVHVATCSPCYDDDVCASARIDTGVKFAFVKAMQVGDAMPDSASAPPSVRPFAASAILPPAVEFPILLIRLRSRIGHFASRNSSVAHRQTVVLLV
jgi:hypothetical protein